MRAAKLSLVALAVLGAGLAGCLGNQAAPSEVPNLSGVHPYPSGSDWPSGLEGPFEILSIAHEQVRAADGIQLDGWVLRPAVPDGVRVPIVLWSSPYFGQCSFMPNTGGEEIPPEYPVCHYDLGDDPELRDGDEVTEAVPIDRLLQEGYAVAVFNVRGTGNSGGCFEWFGPREQADQALLVDWLGEQSWSNGRVAMMGLSYHGTTPWEAAIQNPPHLKTIVVGGMISDPYTFSHTPQGAAFMASVAFDAHYFLRVSASPPLNGPPEHSTTEHAVVATERFCEDVANTLGEGTIGSYSDIRNGAYWDARRLIDAFPGITSSVFLTHGFDDNEGSGHQQQENAVWDTLGKAPKRMLEGQWPHMMPGFDQEFEPTYGEPFVDVVVRWFDYWLKGIGVPEKLGLVEFQDGNDTWHSSTRWPPAEQKEEVLYLADAAASPAPGEEASSFRGFFNDGPANVLCDTSTLPRATFADGVVYLSEPAVEDTFIAGNPMAYLQVESDLPGGLVAVDLFDLGDECAAAIWLGRGVADLRFHDGAFTGHDFPTGVPQPVRLDITDFAEWIPQGHRLGVVISYGDTMDRTEQPYFPTITIHGDGSTASSHVIVPVLEGGFGGSPPTLQYPPRPFVPLEGQRGDSRSYQ